MASIILPNTLQNGQPHDADEVMANFAAIKAFAEQEVIQRDGSVAMTGQLSLVGDPLADAHAARKKYVDDKVSARNRTAVFTRTTDINLSTSSSSGIFDYVSFESESNDVDGYWASGNTITIPATGLYIIGVEWDLNKNIRTSSYEASLNVFGDAETVTPMLEWPRQLVGSSTWRFGHGGVLYLRSGQVIRARYRLQSFSGTQTIAIQEVRLAIRRMT